MIQSIALQIEKGKQVDSGIDVAVVSDAGRPFLCSDLFGFVAIGGAHGVEASPDHQRLLLVLLGAVLR